MRIVFTKGNNPIAKAICWALDEPFSHVGIEHRGLVYHVNMLGMQIEPMKHYIDRAEHSASVNVKNNWLRLYPTVVNNWKKGYDWRAFLHLGVRALLKKFTFGLVKLPKADLRQMTGIYVCTEFVTEVLKEEEMITPFELYRRMR